jgi:hypothetical protein
MDPFNAGYTRGMEYQSVCATGILDRSSISAKRYEWCEKVLEDRLNRRVPNQQDASYVVTVVVVIEVSGGASLISVELADHDVTVVFSNVFTRAHETIFLTTPEC